MERKERMGLLLFLITGVVFVFIWFDANGYRGEMKGLLLSLITTLLLVFICSLLLILIWAIGVFVFSNVNKYQIALACKGEVLIYRDDKGLYSFNVYQTNNVKLLHLPCRKDWNDKYFLTEDEMARIIPRIRLYFSPIIYVGFIPWFHKLKVIEDKVGFE